MLRGHYELLLALLFLFLEFGGLWASAELVEDLRRAWIRSGFAHYDLSICFCCVRMND